MQKHRTETSQNESWIPTTKLAVPIGTVICVIGILLAFDNRYLGLVEEKLNEHEVVHPHLRRSDIIDEIHTGIVTHEKHPHSGAVTRAEYDEVIRQLRQLQTQMQNNERILARIEAWIEHTGDIKK